REGGRQAYRLHVDRGRAAGGGAGARRLLLAGRAASYRHGADVDHPAYELLCRRSRAAGAGVGDLLPSEPDVRVSPHPAQVDAKPRVSEAGVTTVLPSCHLYDTHLQPPDLAVHHGSSCAVPTTLPCQRTPVLPGNQLPNPT